MIRFFTVVATMLIAFVAYAQTASGADANKVQNAPTTNQQGQSPKQGSQSAPPATPATTEKQAQPGTQAGDAVEQKANPDAPNAAEQKVEPKQPTTEILPDDRPLPSADPLVEPGELPRGNVTLIGGRAIKVDRLRNRVTVQPFGGGKKVTVRFDDRSHIYRDGRETTVTGIKEGDRVYLDTMLVGPYVFAKNLRVQTSSGPAEARGQVSQYNAATGRVTMVDQLTTQPVTFTISGQTAITDKARGSATAKDVRPGSLIEVIFSPGTGKGGEARQVTVLASPGARYVFAGRVTNIDLRTNVISVDNQTDQKTYDLIFDPSKVDDRELLQVGAEITARATFDGRNYRASDIAIARPADASAQQ